VLSLKNVQLKTFPKVFETCAIQDLDLSKNQIEEIEFTQSRLADSLLYLDFSSNKIKKIPPSILYLQKLQKLSMAKNKIKVLPAFISDLPVLEKLHLQNNLIRCFSSQALNLGSNLKTSYLRKFKELDLSGNFCFESYSSNLMLLNPLFKPVLSLKELAFAAQFQAKQKFQFFATLQSSSKNYTRANLHEVWNCNSCKKTFLKLTSAFVMKVQNKSVGDFSSKTVFGGRETRFQIYDLLCYECGKVSIEVDELFETIKQLELTISNLENPPDEPIVVMPFREENGDPAGNLLRKLHSLNEFKEKSTKYLIENYVNLIHGLRAFDPVARKEVKVTIFI